MGQDTKIQWATHTFNCWHGCAKVSDGCTNCYAWQSAKRNPGVLGVWGPAGTRVVKSESGWKEPPAWDREAKAAGERRRVFCCSIADVFEDWSGPMVDAKGRVLHYNSAATYWVPEPTPHGPIPMQFVRQRLFDLIDYTPHIDWLLVTKRPENIRRMWPGGRRENVWLLTSVEDQNAADMRIPHLLACRDLAPVLGLSMEPLLGSVDLSKWLPCYRHPSGEWHYGVAADYPHLTPLDWIIAGGESGHGARPCDLAWVRSIVGQCKAAGVPAFVEQLGARPEARCDDGYWRRDRTGSCKDNTCRAVKLDDPKGGDPDEWPEDIRIREFPDAAGVAV